MKKTFYAYTTIILVAAFSCNKGKDQMKTGMQTADSITFITLDPGHFHASLVQKEMYEFVKPEAFVYAPEGPELKDHLSRVEGYNTRTENPLHWEEKIYTGTDYFEKMLAEKPGNVVVLSGNNAKKPEYILKSIESGLNVLADKPMIIQSEDFAALQNTFRKAGENNLLLYDIMTERYEITNTLQKELAAILEVFGELQSGTPESPAVVKESVHHLFKFVSGKALVRPPWFFDVTQQGEGLVDVTTHLVDLVQWACFPGKVIDYEKDVEIISASHWTTDLTAAQFTEVTGLTGYPDYLQKYFNNDLLKVYCNGKMNYKINGIYVGISVTWNFKAPEGTGDTHYSIMKGSRCNLIIRQGKGENYQPQLFIEAVDNPDNFAIDLQKTVLEDLQTNYPGISLEQINDKEWKVVIPDNYKVGHEAHFAQVTQKFLSYLRNGDMPGWEVPNMIAKYYITTEALKMAKSNPDKK